VSESNNLTFSSPVAVRNPGLNQQKNIQETLPGGNSFFNSSKQTNFQKIRNKLWPIKNNERDSISLMSSNKSAQANNLIINTQFSDGIFRDSGAFPFQVKDDNGRRRTALERLLMKPVVSMRGIAYDNKAWYDFDSERDFHSSCSDFLKIVMLSDAQDTARQIKNFITGNMLEPRFTPPEHEYNGGKLNHFKTFWNVMHQLPFNVGKFDYATQAKLKWFYEVGIRDTLPCEICKKHYSMWVVEKPVTANSLEELNMWLFKLHDHVNWSSKKPSFPWSMYKRRWGPRGQYDDVMRTVSNATSRNRVRGQYDDVMRTVSDVRTNDITETFWTGAVDRPVSFGQSVASEMYPVMLNYDGEVPTNVIPAYNSEFVQIVN